jgi:dihydroorotase
MPRNSGKIRLVRRTWRMPEKLPFGGDELVPLRAGETLVWQLD